MLGSNVFKFSMTVVPEQVQAYLAREGLSFDGIDLVLLHQGSRFIVDNLGRKLGLRPEKAPFEAGNWAIPCPRRCPSCWSRGWRRPRRGSCCAGSGSACPGPRWR